MKTEKTLTIQGTRTKNESFNGWRVLVGNKKGSGMFEYCKGDLVEAKKMAKIMTNHYLTILNLKARQKPVITLEQTKLKKCDISYCNHLTEENERYCDRCDELMLEAQMEYSEMKEKEAEIYG